MITNMLPQPPDNWKFIQQSEYIDHENCLWFDNRDNNWHTGPLPRTYDDIMAGRETSIKFYCCRKAAL